MSLTYARDFSLVRRWFVLGSGAALLLAAAFVWLEAPPEQLGDSAGRVAGLSVATLTSGEPVPRRGAGTSLQHDNSLDSNACDRASPFGGVIDERCAPGIPSAEVAAQSDAMDEDTLLRGYTSQKATAVLLRLPGAAVEAYKATMDCSRRVTLTEAQLDECDELKKVMPDTLATLMRESDRGSASASLQLARFYSQRLFALPYEFHREYLAYFDKYATAASFEYPSEIKELSIKVAVFRI